LCCIIQSIRLSPTVSSFRDPKPKWVLSGEKRSSTMELIRLPIYGHMLSVTHKWGGSRAPSALCMPTPPHDAPAYRAPPCPHQLHRCGHGAPPPRSLLLAPTNSATTRKHRRSDDDASDSATDDPSDEPGPLHARGHAASPPPPPLLPGRLHRRDWKREQEKERTKLWEQHWSSITSRMLAGLQERHRRGSTARLSTSAYLYIPVELALGPYKEALAPR
jgi:hypothetical protein